MKAYRVKRPLSDARGSMIPGEIVDPARADSWPNLWALVSIGYVEPITSTESTNVRDSQIANEAQAILASDGKGGLFS